MNSELPSTASFEAASKAVRPDDIADAIPCGDSVETVVDAVVDSLMPALPMWLCAKSAATIKASSSTWWKQSLGPALGA